MASMEELRNERIKKIEQLQKQGINAFPADSLRTHTISQALADFEFLSESKKEIVLAGRVVAKREHGSLLFLDVENSYDKIQFYFQKSNFKDEEQFARAKEFLDLGDFIEASGKLIITQSGQKSLDARLWRILTKAIRPIPETYYGLKDVEERLRRRYLDLLANHDVRQMFEKKSVFWGSLRQFLKDRGFLEVETPVLETVPGGAEAEPFITHYNALDGDFYLRISLELPLKRLIVGGFEKVFEIGRIFRNEGIDAEHLQDYTQLEFYWSYADYNDLMKLVQEMYQFAIEKTAGSLKTIYDQKEIDWSGEWPKVDYFEVFQKQTGIDLNKASEKDLAEKALELGLKFEKSAGWGRLVDLVFKKACRPNFIQPCFLIDPPIQISPLSKKSFKNPNRAERVQIMAGGSELGNGFSELNDPLDQRARFEQQMKLREQGDKEAQMIDEDFIEALEYGMPPTAGFGLSERLFAFIMDKPIRETVIFPPMKERNN